MISGWFLRSTCLFVLSIMILVGGCTRESDQSLDKQPLGFSKQDWHIVANKKSNQPSNTPVFSQVQPKSANKAPEPTTPQEPEAVNGLVPYVEANSKFAEQKLVQDLLKQANGKVQVIEFFNYPCPWCAQIDPVLLTWLKTKPKNITFIRVPALFYPHWEIYSKIYYLIESLAATNSIKNTAPIHAAFFELVSQNLAIGHDLPAIYAFFVQQNLAQPNTEAAFIEKLNAMDPHADVFFAYRIKAIPTFVVQGKKGIYSTNISQAGSSENVFKVIDYLAAINR